jgi:LysM repeat protein
LIRLKRNHFLLLIIPLTLLVSLPVQINATASAEQQNNMLSNNPGRGSAFIQDATATFDLALLNIQTATPQNDGSIIHTVVEGQSLWDIALAYGVYIGDIQNLNSLDPENSVIQAGQKLMIFPPGSIVTEIPAATDPPAAQTAAAARLITPTITETPLPTNTATPSGFSIPDEVQERISKPGSLIFPVMAIFLIAAGFFFRWMVKSLRGQ